MIIHLLGYNYDLITDRELEQADLLREISLRARYKVSSVFLLSPDLGEEADLEFNSENGLLLLSATDLSIWDVLAIK